MARARWLVLLGVAAAVWAAVTFLPELSAGQANLTTAVSANNPAVAAQAEAVREFGFPPVTRTAAVQRNPRGFDGGAGPVGATRRLFCARRWKGRHG